MNRFRCIRRFYSTAPPILSKVNLLSAIDSPEHNLSAFSKSYPCHKTPLFTHVFYHRWYSAPLLTMCPRPLSQVRQNAQFKDNAAAMQTLVDDLRSKVSAISLGGDEKARQRHLSKGKLLPRDRIATVLDPGSPFLELSQMAGYVVTLSSCLYFNLYSCSPNLHRDSHTVIPRYFR